jgi:ribonuclease HII
MPDLELERAAGGLVAGVDEAGRGPWAGPVVAAAVILERGGVGLLDGIEESKRLTRARRAELFTVLKGSARLGIGAASVPEIDRLNILQATLLAMARAIRALGVTPDLALIDGPHAPDLPCPVRTVVRGDAASLSIAAASIVAKVTRDEVMARLARRHPGFGWERNAGYGTPQHQAALARLGPTPHHRRSFAPIINILSRL